VVGLGNPGSEFAGARHNAGAEVVGVVAERHQARLKAVKGLHSRVAEVRIGDRRVLLAVPDTYMNESGRAVAPLVRRSGIDQADVAPGQPLARRLIIVHDELDLPSGRVKIKAGGGTAGNNGLKSIESHLHTNEYLRVRVGIGKPPGRQPGADYVLKRPGSAERAVLDVAIELAADAVEAIVAEGPEAAMNRVNAADGGSAGAGAAR
jgi:PTH1 family peptidyl-tRNA hydrolase